MPRIVKMLEAGQEFTNTTATQISDWSIPVKAGEQWIFFASLQFGTTNSSNDCQLRIEAPANTTGTYGTTTAETAQSSVHGYSSNSGSLGMTTGGDTILVSGGAVFTEDGDWVFNSRLNTGSGSGLLTLSTGSHLIAQRIK